MKVIAVKVIFCHPMTKYLFSGREVISMCSVGDMFDVDISGDATMSEYVCSDCGKEFKGIGKNLRCPKCHSLKVSKK
jgi:DNA-directed RNA polymerase subunit RPC12/RpoP